MMAHPQRSIATFLTVAVLSSTFAVATVGAGWGKSASNPQISNYIKQLKTDKDWRKRSQAASALGGMSQEADTVVPALIEALQDRDEVVRLRASLALAKFGSQAAPELIEALKAENEAARTSAAFALRYMGFPVAPMLADALKSGDTRVRSLALSTLKQMATDLQRRPLSQSPSIAELQQAVSALEAAQQEMERFIKLRNPTIGLANSIALREAGYSSEDEEAIRQSLITFRRDIQDYYTGIALTVTLRVLGILVLVGAFILWSRPELLLRLSRAIVRAKENREVLAQVLAEVEQFLKQAGATTQRDGQHGLQMTSAPGRLKSYLPLPVTFADEPVDRDVTELVQSSARLAGKRPQQAGILLYREPPDTLFRMRMAEVRLRDGFVLLPIPLAAVEQVLLDRGASAGLLAQYTDRYLPGADLFDDRNAIGDTMSFFGRGELLQRLEEDLHRGQGIGLFGLRKSGKTSILLQLGFAMRRHPVIHIDLQPYGGKLRYGAELFDRILQKLAQFVKERSPKSRFDFNPLLPENRPASELTADFSQQMSKLASKLSQAGYELPILLFLDEIERILPTQSDVRERAEEFNACFGALRALSQERRLLSLLVADVHPDCNRINQWQQADVPTNPVFNFFKEVFVLPFSPEETTRMLTDIGELMGVKFDDPTLSAIHRESGGHPFVSRQLASLLCKQLSANSNGEIQESAAQRYLDRPFTYSGVLKDYFAQNIWGDLDKRNFDSAMAILKLLSCNEDWEITETIIVDRLRESLTESDCLDALLWLESVGLLYRPNSKETDRYRIQVPLMSRWLRMQMKEEEIRQWQLQ
ncbi:MAG TPA: HEAT repeat domain-containing protein [Microcoleus sp.]|nr:HEAT repeat domain-containing protein [Microcoleus sp.]